MAAATSPSPPGGTRPRKIYVDGVPRDIIAERVEYLDENGKLVTESLRDFTKKALKKRFASLDDFLKRWNCAERKQAIIEELEAEGLPLDADRRGSRQGPRSLRPHLPRRLRPASRSPAASGPTMSGSATFSPNTARRPAPCSTRCWKNIRTRACSNLDDPNVLQIPPFERMGTPCNSSRLRRHGGLRDRPSTNCRPHSIRKSPKLMSVRTTVKSIQDIMRQDAGVDGDAQRISQLCWMFFLKIIDDQDQELELTASRLPLAHPRATSSGATGRPTPRASPARRCSPSSTTSCFPALKEPAVTGQPGDRRRVVRDVFEDAYNYMKSGQLHAAGGQQDQRHRLQQSRRAPALRRHLRADPQRPADRRATRASTTRRAPSPPSWWTASTRSPAKSCSTPPAAPAASSPAPSATCASAT